MIQYEVTTNNSVNILEVNMDNQQIINYLTAIGLIILLIKFFPQVSGAVKKFFNEYWTRPDESEKPKNPNVVEGAIYW